MEPIKIRITDRKCGRKDISVKKITEQDGELLIKINGDDCFDIYPGMELTFYRNIYTNGGAHFTISQSVNVLSEDKDHTIHTEIINGRTISVYNKEDSVREAKWIAQNEDGEDVEVSYHYVRTMAPHNIFPQDLRSGTQEIIFKDYKDAVLASFSGDSINIPLKYGDLPATSADCITFVGKEETCGKKFNSIDVYRYDFLSEKISNDIIMVSGLTSDVINNMSKIEIKYNPFYYYYDKDPIEFDKHGNPIKECKLYSDPWWGMYKIKTNNNEGKLYVNSGCGETKISYNTYFWETNVGLSSFSNETTLGSSDNFNTKFVEDTEQSLIPEIIDMERIKYSPMTVEGKNNTVYYKLVSKDDDEYPIVYTNQWIDRSNDNLEDGKKVDVYVFNGESFDRINEDFYYDAYNVDGCKLFREVKLLNNMVTTFTYSPNNEIVNNSLSPATSITISLHFRKRDEIKVDDMSDDEELAKRRKNTLLTSGNVYTDGWFINQDDEPSIWWNGFNFDGENFDDGKFKTFIKESGETSDLLGYLNFTDDDIFYRKKKVSQSFLRFSFYSSKDPIEQKLLFYSTKFFDSTGLYGKYINQLMFMEENDLFNEENNPNINLNAAVVFSSADTEHRVDSKIVITNEYDKTQSAEGFNIYLFEDDKNLNLENSEKTIYMKVEFNHAGNGKTIPMIMWPKSGALYEKLTVDNFIDSLYIPVKLVYINGKYVYYIPSAYKNENGNISLVLFEPKLDFVDETPNQ